MANAVVARLALGRRALASPFGRGADGAFADGGDGPELSSSAMDADAPSLELEAVVALLAAALPLRPAPAQLAARHSHERHPSAGAAGSADLDSYCAVCGDELGEAEAAGGGGNGDGDGDGFGGGGGDEADSSVAFASFWRGPLSHVFRGAALVFPLRLRPLLALATALCATREGAAEAVAQLHGLRSYATTLAALSVGPGEEREMMGDGEGGGGGAGGLAVPVFDLPQPDGELQASPLPHRAAPHRPAPRPAPPRPPCRC